MSDPRSRSVARRDIHAPRDRLEVIRPDEADGRGRFLPLRGTLLVPDVQLSDLLTLMEAEREFQWYVVDHESASQRPRPVPSPSDDARLQVGVRRRPASVALWRPFLHSLGVPIEARPDAEQESVVFAVRVPAGDSYRTLLWTFGDASRSIPHSASDSRFGLLVALNKHEAGTDAAPWRTLPIDARRPRGRGDPSARVRGISHDVRDGYRHRTSSRSSEPAPVDGLRFDSVSDLLRSLTLRTEDELMCDIEGGRTLGFSTYIDCLDDLARLADHVVALRARRDYLRGWEWIDHIVPVIGTDAVNEVLDDFSDALASQDELAVDIVWPTLATAEETASRRVVFALPYETSLMRTNLTWPQLRRWLLTQTEHPGYQTLRKAVRVKLEGVDGPAERFPLFELLVAEFAVDGQWYVISDGEILRVDKPFLERLHQQVARAAPWSNFPFPTFQGGTEPEYVGTAPGRSGGRMAKLDGLDIRLPGQTPFEACDLLTDDGRLVYGKLKGKSSLFSHLCVQAETAAEVLLRSEDARAEFLRCVGKATSDSRLLAAAEAAMGAIAARRTWEVTITLLLLGPWRDRNVASLPLVSRIRLQRTAQRITTLGYGFEVAAPPLEVCHIPSRKGS